MLVTGDLEVTDRHDLYGLAIAGDMPVRLNPQLGDGDVPELSFCPYPSCSGFPPLFDYTWLRISPDSARAVFTTRESAGSLRELYSEVVYLTYGPNGQALFQAALDGSPATRRLSAPTVPMGSVHAFSITPDSRYVVYRADQDSDETVELYASPLIRVPRRAGPPQRRWKRRCRSRTAFEDQPSR